MFDPPAKHEERNWKDNLAHNVGLGYIGGMDKYIFDLSIFSISDLRS